MVKTEIAKINPKKNDTKCFQSAITVVLNYKNILKDWQKKSKIKPFINQYHWKEINLPSHKNDWKKFESWISYVYFTLVKKEYMHIFQNITQRT